MRVAAGKSRPTLLLLVSAVVTALGSARPVVACSVCFGDPDSAMAKGALMGVYVLGAVIGFVLFGVAGTAVFWVQRGRRLARQSRTENSANR